MDEDDNNPDEDEPLRNKGGRPKGRTGKSKLEKKEVELLADNIIAMPYLKMRDELPEGQQQLAKGRSRIWYWKFARVLVLGKSISEQS